MGREKNMSWDWRVRLCRSTPSTNVAFYLVCSAFIYTKPPLQQRHPCLQQQIIRTLRSTVLSGISNSPIIQRGIAPPQGLALSIFLSKRTVSIPFSWAKISAAHAPDGPPPTTATLYFIERADDAAERWVTGVEDVKEEGVKAAAEPTAIRERAAVNFMLMYRADNENLSKKKLWVELQRRRSYKRKFAFFSSWLFFVWRSIQWSVTTVSLAPRGGVPFARTSKQLKPRKYPFINEKTCILWRTNLKRRYIEFLFTNDRLPVR